MRLVKIISMALAIAAVTAAAMADQGSNVANRFGKGPTTAGLSLGRGNYYSRGNVFYAPTPVIATAPRVAPAPVVASVPATTGRRSFSAEPAAPQATAPAAVSVARAGVVRSQGSGVENRFGKGPTTIGLTPGRR